MEQLGIPEKKLKQFHKKKITTLENLVEFYPTDYRDYSTITDLTEGQVCIVARIEAVYSGMSGSGIHYINAKGTCRGKSVSVVWFNSRFLLNDVTITKGHEVLIGGKASYNDQYESYTITSPDIYTEDVFGGPCILPVYSKIPGMAVSYLRDCLDKAFSILPYKNNGNMPYLMEREFGLISYREAQYLLHFPKSMKEIAAARRRMLYDDLYVFALAMAKAEQKQCATSFVKISKDEVTREMIGNLPFSLTPDQRGTVNKLYGKFRSGKPVHALIQGDVGCGKTIVAAIMISLLSENGYQSALMAPTSVLARQHYEELSSLLEPYGIRVLFVPSLSWLKKKDKAELLNHIKNGDHRVLIGTHSLLSDQIEFHNLGLIVTDEEHKFGVDQREMLLKRASDGIHYLTMSATPIPRSLAGIVYGKTTSLYSIKSMPAGREPVQTAISHSWNTCMTFVRRQLDAGRQVYVVCPQIDDNMEGVLSVKELEKKYVKEFGKEAVCTLSGRNKKSETDKILYEFSHNEKQILIATTVIEVGVNVPNANTIIIHNAERFGLASLHQLRGRVGRGGGKAYCILFSEDRENERLRTMCSTNDGFEIAEADLRIRGAGELIGVAQSGISRYTNQVIHNQNDYQKILAYIEERL